MKKSGILLLFCFLAMNIYAQSNHFNIKGIVKDGNNNPVGFANVVLRDSLANRFFAAATDEKGAFELSVLQGKYVITVSSIGYKTYREDITVDGNRHWNEIVLSESSIQLGEVTVKGIRPKVTFKNDRFEIDIENSMAATGNSIESLLVQLPGVWATPDGNISINGISGTQVIINDRVVKLSGAALMRYLHSFRSENISKIEVIQRPSSTYDAEGSGGIIRIITKKTEDEGWRGMAGTRIDMQRFFGVSPFASLNYDKGKFGVGISLNGQNAKWLLLSDNRTKDIVNDITYETTTRDTIYDTNYSANLDFYYAANRRNRLALNINYLYWGKNEYMNGGTDIGGGAGNTGRTDTRQKDEQNMNNYSATLNYNLLIDSLGTKKLTVMVDFANQYRYNIKNYYEYLNFDLSDDLISHENILNDQESPYRIFSTEARYSGSYGNKGTVTGGIKYSNSTVENSLANYERIQNIWTVNNDIGYDYKYNEQLTSGFVQYALKHKKWDFTGGLRGEYTHGTIRDIEPAYKKFNLFPSVFVNFQADERNTLGVSYNQRIQRVSYLRLLPRRYFTSRYTALEGNPDLKPNIINNIGLNYQLSGKYSFSVSYRWSDNALSAYSRIETIDNYPVAVYSYVDGIKTNSINCNAYLPVKIVSWWSTLNQLNFNYNRYEIPAKHVEYFSYDLFTQHTFLMPLGIKAEILYRYISSSKGAYETSFPYHLLNAAIQKSFLNDRLNAKMEATRILYNQKMGSKTITQTAEIINKMYYTRRPFFAVTLSYSFSKGKIQKRENIQRSNEQEKSRTY